MTLMVRRTVPSFATATLLVCGTAVQANAQSFAYVAGDGDRTVAVINIETNAVTATITLPPGDSPSRLAAAPNATRVYVTNANVPGTVSVIDTATNSLLVPDIIVGN